MVLQSNSLQALIIDVRGTLVHPSLDVPIHGKVLEQFAGVVRRSRYTAIITAASIATVKLLVVDPLVEAAGDKADLLSRLILYVDSSTAAYDIRPGIELAPLKAYDFLQFSDQALEVTLKAMKDAVELFHLFEAHHKIKAGQINFYCGGPLANRLRIAHYINERLSDSGFSQVVAEVPTSKETIDIAVCTKARGVHDFVKRFSLKPSTIAVVADSLFEGGPDASMYAAIPECQAIQIGNAVPLPGVVHFTSKTVNADPVATVLEHLSFGATST